MALLRFEIWETANSQECAAVSEAWDRLRDPDARFVEAFYASTQEEAMVYRNKRNGWRPYEPVPGLTGQIFSDAQYAEQEAYLSVRAVR
jgi:hypothetical protein